MTDNIILATDSYKMFQYLQYPRDTQYVYSYFESRGGEWQESLFFGLQYLLKEYLCGKVVSKDKIDEAENFVQQHFGEHNGSKFNRRGWEYILNNFDGYLPLSIKAVPEGTVVPVRNVLMTVQNTVPECYWLTNYVETLLSQVWYPCTVATQSFQMRHLLAKYLRETADSLEGLDFMLHDFGFRGVSSFETSGIGDAAHLAAGFKGTDTISGILFAQKYYQEPMAAFSVPASEHSTITSWGREHEEDAYQNMLKQFPVGIVSVVSDSYNIFDACRNIWGSSLRDMVMQRDGMLVVRPDSGDPVQVLLNGNENVFDILSDAFGYCVNEKGFKVLNKVRVLQGDGINFETLGNILFALKQKGYSAENIVFGSGGALLQKLNRDTLKFAYKCSQVVVGDEPRDVYKDPITDQGKQSKRGKLALVCKDGKYSTVKAADTAPEDNCLVPVFLDGKILKDYTLSEIRARSQK
jgi:nicotinamide phosphoribosyltransferase